MAKKSNEETVPEISNLDVVDENTTDDMVDKDMLETIAPQDDIPGRLDIGWSDFVMSQFDKSELAEKKDIDNFGNERKQIFPRVHGLRRLAQKYVGDIIDSVCDCVSPPSINDAGSINFAAYIYTVRFRKHEDGQIVTYSDAADCYYHNKISNNVEVIFARFPSALASTRAEARALRKALGLITCSAEELAPNLPKGADIVKAESMVNPDEQSPTTIDRGQIHFIQVKSKALNIHPWKLLNSGQEKFTKLTDVPFDIAKKFCKLLGEMLRAKDNKGDLVAEYSVENSVDLGNYSDSWEPK